MKREFLENPKLPENHDYKRGQKFGLTASNPFLTSQLTDESPITGRKEFLAGYGKGLKAYLKTKGIRLPAGTTDLEYDIDYPPFLAGIITGLERNMPNVSKAFKFEGSGEYEDEQTWANTYMLISHITKKDGYMVGFLASLARDYNIITNGHAVPDDNTQYQIYLEGLNAEPSDYFLAHGDKSLGWIASAEYNKRIYLTGLKVWVVEHGLGICPVQLMHPQTLEAFKRCLETPDIQVSNEQSYQIQNGYELARTVPTIPSGKWPK